MREENDTWTPRKLTREAARAEQRVYWSTKSIAERLRAIVGADPAPVCDAGNQSQ